MPFFPSLSEAVKVPHALEEFSIEIDRRLIGLHKKLLRSEDSPVSETRKELVAIFVSGANVCKDCLCPHRVSVSCCPMGIGEIKETESGPWVANKNTLYRLVLLIIFFLTGITWANADSAPILIAHAGGAVNKLTYTNSLEALNENYAKGYRYFEIDLSWTSDGELVAIHDWDQTYRGLFQLDSPASVPSREEFLSKRMKSGLTPLSLKQVLEWAATKKDALIVTDVKSQNLDALGKISTDFARYQKFVIPQVYSFQGYDDASKLGYDKIITTLYRMEVSPCQVLSFAKEKAPFAITMSRQNAESGLADMLDRNGIIVYAHTVNDPEIFEALRKIGVYGIYSDFIEPF